MNGKVQISTPFFLAGIIICVIWFLATLLVKEQNRKKLMLMGGATSIILLVYTQQWKLYVIGILGGLFCGGIGIGYRQDKLREVHQEIGVVQTMMIWAILFALMFMVMAASAPDVKWL